MKPQQDPVVQNLTEWINRSAGQHQRRISEGAESAARLLRLPVVDAMTDDRLNLHRVDISQLGKRDGVSVGDCCHCDVADFNCNQGRDCPERIEYAGEEPYSALSLVWAVAVVGALCLLVWYISPELRALVSIIKN